MNRTELLEALNSLFSGSSGVSLLEPEPDPVMIVVTMDQEPDWQAVFDNPIFQAMNAPESNLKDVPIVVAAPGINIQAIFDSRGWEIVHIA